MNTNNSCSYCQKETKLSCKDCDMSFCNARANGTASHLIFHAIKRKHRSIKINNEVLKCQKCQAESIFNLGYIKNSNISSIPIENICCRSCMSSPEWEPIIQERALVDGFNIDLEDEINNQISLTPKELIKIEEKNNVFLPKATLSFTMESYKNIFTKLIIAELQTEKDMKENISVDNVKVRFDKVKKEISMDQALSYAKNLGVNVKNQIIKKKKKSKTFCYFSINECDGKIRPGDEIYITGFNVSISAFVVDNNSFSEEIKAKVYKINGQIIENTLYTIKIVCVDVHLPRMLNAINKIQKFDKEILDCILGKESKDEELRLLKQFSDQSRKDQFVEIENPPKLPTLNQSQTRAVKAAISNKITLIQGPPGTGKTCTSAAIVYNLIKKKKGKILVVANSNTAADNLTRKIFATGAKILRVVSKRRENYDDDLSFLTLHTQTKLLCKDILDKKSADKQNENNDSSDDYEEESQLKDAIKHRLLQSADVIACTCVTAGAKIFNRFKFPYILIDEAVQSIEPVSLIPLIYGCKNLVLVGDHKQLGPIIFNKSAARAGLKRTLFERLLQLGHIPCLLNVQYRMHPKLAEWPSNRFYNGSLINGITDTMRLNKLDLPFPAFFYACNGKEELSSSGTSFLNQPEAWYCHDIIKKMVQSGIKESQIGIITPYEGQRSHIIKIMMKSDLKVEDLEIANVDGYQGREKDFIIISVVRSNLQQGIGFVSDKRRLNVALTRARYGCVIIGNTSTLVKNEMWHNLLEYYQKNRSIYEGSIHSLQQKEVIKKKSTIDLKELFETIL